MMIKIKLLDTKEVVEATPNVAHGLVESGKAEFYTPKKKTYKSKPKRKYKNKMMRSE